LFATGVVEQTANLPPVSLTTVANLPPVSTTLVKLVAKFAAGVVDTGGNFAAGFIDTGGQPPRIFKQIRNGPNGIIRGLGESDL
jgi:hypothetical protein